MEESNLQSTGEIPLYPGHWDAEVVLSDGRPCVLRPVRRGDGEVLAEFFGKLSERTLQLRYFTANPDLAAKEAAKLVAVDQHDHVGLVALLRGAVIAVASYDLVARSEAEIAFTVADECQGRGLGSLLLEHLAAIARENGIHRFSAEVLAENKAMLRAFGAAGYQISQELSEGIVQLDFGIDPTPGTRAIARIREHRADVNSISPLLTPAGVAVISHSMSEGSVADQLLRHIKDAGFRGNLAAVSPENGDSADVPSYSKVADIAGPIELAVVAVPPENVDGVLADCAASGVRGVVLIRTSHDGPEDLARQRQLVGRIRVDGMRLVGPRAMGIVNTDPRSLLNASLSPELPGRGRVGLFCQSAAVGEALLAQFKRRDIGLTAFMSAGSGADVSVSELLQYWGDDEGTGLIVADLESISNPRKFVRVATAVAQNKPVVVMRAGRAARTLPFGAEVCRTDLSPRAIDQIFEAAGIIQVNSLDDLADTAALIALQPLPAGDRVAVITDSHALGRLAVDSAASLGLYPVGSAEYFDGEQVAIARQLINERLADPEVDMLVVAHAAGPDMRDQELRDLVAESARESTKPVVAVMLAQGPEPLAGDVGPHGLPAHGSVPVFPDVEAAFRALSAVVKYVRWRSDPDGDVADLPLVEPPRAHAIAAGRLRRREASDFDDRLNSVELTDLLAAYGVDLWPAIPVRSEEQAVMAAHSIGFPVVLKSMRPQFSNAVESGAVRLNLENERALRTAYLSVTATLSPEAREALVVQRMAPPGIGCVLHANEDPLFGSVLRFRMGGPAPRILADYGYMIPPITPRDAERLIRLPEASPLLLGGGRRTDGSATSVDIAALIDLIVRIGRLGDDLPEILSLSLDPVIVHARGVAVLNADARVARPEARTDLEARRL
ncbi:MAG: GNAT family N-acetyltransferase [Candidatus Nanopelagicales bacterium]|nr:GNAT family N-acetyltransferase [Candidatus Nanopelagicales bacterium]